MTGSIVGVFILGILAGWLAEWLFITFVMEKKSTNPTTKPKSVTTTEAETVSQLQSQAQVAANVKQDDFIKLKGIGPKLSASIKAININRYDELASFSGEALLEKLEASGAVIVNRPAFVHIPQQAALAAKGDWDALEVLKKSI
jgi:small subunit ribosomal protein S2